MEEPILWGSFLPYRHAHIIYTYHTGMHILYIHSSATTIATEQDTDGEYQRDYRKCKKIFNNTGSQVATQMGVKWALNLTVHSKYAHHVVIGDVKDHAVLHLKKKIPFCGSGPPEDLSFCYSLPIPSLWAPHLPSHFFISNSCMQ